MEKAKKIIERQIKSLREETPKINFDNNKLAEIEINKIFYEGKVIDRVMVVLRANGCEHYKKTGGCSMCSHFNGTSSDNPVTTANYIKQWDSAINGEGIEKKGVNFNINDFPVVCVYNLGSLLNLNEITIDAIKYIFKSLNNYKGVKKVIIESRAEYITDDIIKSIKEVYSGILEVGIGVESTNFNIRELCHHKGLDDVESVKKSIEILHRYNCKALAYINFKPVFLTENEAIDDAIKTANDCINMKFDAISIEPTSLQNYSLANYLYLLGYYRVPWLWSITKIVNGIYSFVKDKFDVRIGGYFDEEVLSGSQGIGYEEKNEIFPHSTSSNCPFCTNKFIDAIKMFNATYNIKYLNDVIPCNHCYKLWNETLKIKDSRKIEQRIFDVLGGSYED